MDARSACAASTARSFREGERHCDTDGIILFCDSGGDIAMQWEQCMASALCLALSLAVIVLVGFEIIFHNTEKMNVVLSALLTIVRAVFGWRGSGGARRRSVLESRPIIPWKLISGPKPKQATGEKRPMTC
ncbi:MAG: hypothetical protein RSD93_09125 [Gordonibacter sp.]|uniref:hypothetical protein n=2 Tax=Gordonibacter sp. TaxID=1968902 RepID=UPI002FC72643